MDDKKLKAEFPLGDLKIVVTEPSDGQLFALSLGRVSSDGDNSRLVRRLLRVLEALTGPEQWYETIEDALIEERITPEQLIRMADDVFRFPWKEHREPQEVPAETPSTPPSAVPRIVSGG